MGIRKIIHNLIQFLRLEKEETKETISEMGMLVEGEALLIKERIEKRKRKQRRLTLIIGSLVLCIVFLGVLTAYSQYRLYKLSKEEKVVGIPKDKQPRTGEEIIKALSTLILLPEGEPQIAEVQDAEKLKVNQAFFENAQNGDVVVVYTSSIYLYRPSEHILVNFGEISSLR